VQGSDQSLFKQTASPFSRTDWEKPHCPSSLEILIWHEEWRAGILTHYTAILRCTLKFHDMKAHRGAEIKIYAIYTSTLGGNLRTVWILGSNSGGCCLLLVGSLPGLFLYSDDGGSASFETLVESTISFFLRPLLHRPTSKPVSSPPPIWPVISEFERTFIKIA
jgi:hypothetical protein